MEVIILGSGTCVPSLRRAGPAACLRVSGVTLLIDSASGTLRQLLKAGIRYDQIDYILYTHRHPDHVGELVPFIFATKYGPGFTRNSPVTIFAAEGFCKFYEDLKMAFGEWITIKDDSILFEEVPANMACAMQLPPLIIRSAPTKHTPHSLAFRIESEEGDSVVFSGDTDFSEELIDLAEEADLLVCECAAPEGLKVEGHLTPSEAGRIAALAKAKRLLLTHFYPECDRHDILTPCRKEYGGPIILAEDLMRLVLL